MTTFEMTDVTNAAAVALFGDIDDVTDSSRTNRNTSISGKLPDGTFAVFNASDFGDEGFLLQLSLKAENVHEHQNCRCPKWNAPEDVWVTRNRLLSPDLFNNAAVAEFIEMVLDTEMPNM